MNNVNVNDILHLSKNQKRQRKKELKHFLRLKNTEMTIKKINEKALNLIKQAQAFKVPHMMKAADETQRQINNGTIKVKHIQTLAKFKR